MSRRSVLWKKKIGQQWTDGSGKMHTSQAGGDVDKLLPVNAARGTGEWLSKMQDSNAGGGVGQKVTEPMNPEKEARIRDLANPKKRRR